VNISRWPTAPTRCPRRSTTPTPRSSS
jgi:hypothetical protein